MVEQTFRGGGDVALGGATEGLCSVLQASGRRHAVAHRLLYGGGAVPLVLSDGAYLQCWARSPCRSATLSPAAPSWQQHRCGCRRPHSSCSAHADDDGHVQPCAGGWRRRRPGDHSRVTFSARSGKVAALVVDRLNTRRGWQGARWCCCSATVWHCHPPPPQASTRAYIAVRRCASADSHGHTSSPLAMARR
jgi:hypothetical protein